MLVFSPSVNIVPLFVWSHKNMLNCKTDITLCIEGTVRPERRALSPVEQCPLMSEQCKGAERVGSPPPSLHTPAVPLLTLKHQSHSPVSVSF